MEKSDSIKCLAMAMSKAQGEMGGAHKGAENPFFNSKYADLKSVVKAVKEPFANNGLSYVQFPVEENNRIGVETILMHESGEWLSNSFTVALKKQDAQGAGSAITYCRRYGLQAIAGIPSDDDDGNAASKGGDNNQGKVMPTDLDMTWVNAGKIDVANLNQLEDPVYRAKIELFIKEGY
tara:strand:+ start:2191 stop:2727 length:537 start_codon:yes stop_codon:yes gene_type:complete